MRLAQASKLVPPPPLPLHPQALAQITGLAAGGGDSSAPPPHVFQTLIYLRKLTSHPLLVLDPAQPAHMQVGGAGLGQVAAK